MKIDSLVNPNKQQKNHRDIQIIIQSTILKRKNRLLKIFQNPINRMYSKKTIKVNLNQLLLTKSQNLNLENLSPPHTLNLKMLF